MLIISTWLARFAIFYEHMGHISNSIKQSESTSIWYQIVRIRTRTQIGFITTVFFTMLKLTRTASNTHININILTGDISWGVCKVVRSNFISHSFQPYGHITLQFSTSFLLEFLFLKGYFHTSWCVRMSLIKERCVVAFLKLPGVYTPPPGGLKVLHISNLVWVTSTLFG